MRFARGVTSGAVPARSLWRVLLAATALPAAWALRDVLMLMFASVLLADVLRR